MCAKAPLRDCARLPGLESSRPLGNWHSSRAIQVLRGSRHPYSLLVSVRLSLDLRGDGSRSVGGVRGGRGVQTAARDQTDARKKALAEAQALAAEVEPATGKQVTWAARGVVVGVVGCVTDRPADARLEPSVLCWTAWTAVLCVVNTAPCARWEGVVYCCMSTCQALSGDVIAPI